MKYKLKADILFEADDLDDAFCKLALHFLKLKEDETSDLFVIAQKEGKIEIKPFSEKQGK